MSEDPGSSFSDSETPKTKPAKVKKRKKYQAKKVLANFQTPRPKFGMMVDRLELLPPTTPGSYSRWVSTVDGTVSYVRTKPMNLPPSTLTPDQRCHEAAIMKSRRARMCQEDPDSCSHECNGFHLGAANVQVQVLGLETT